MANIKHSNLEDLLEDVAGKNMALSDEEMAKASGGNSGDAPANRFNAGDKVFVWNDPGEVVEVIGYYYEHWCYRVFLDNDPSDIFCEAELALNPR